MIPTMRKMIHRKNKYSDEVRYRFVKRQIRHMQESGDIHTEVYGTENLPEDGGYVMFPNHQGKYDALAIIYAHKRPCSFVMDKAKSYGFLVKEFVDMVGGKRLDLDDIRQNMRIINEISDEVRAGRRFIIFSEGGYNKNHNHVQEFKPGSFKCATRAEAPIVPVALIDTYIPFNSTKLGRCISKVIFLPPLYYEDYKDKKTPEIAAMVRRMIIDKMAEFGVDGESQRLAVS